MLQAQDPTLLAPFVEVARALEQEGARLITTSCGFLAGWQAELQAAVEAAVRLVMRHPELQSVVLECTNMPPYRAVVERACVRPVHDLETLLLDAWCQWGG